MKARIIEIKGNILLSKADAVINTVNCEGVMGKGLALMFKNECPEMFNSYKKACMSNAPIRLQIGNLHTYKVNEYEIINFPTKDKWRNPSLINYIEMGLITLYNYLKSSDIKSIAIPPLGCGNGGLSYSDVKPMIINTLSDLDIDIILY